MIEESKQSAAAFERASRVLVGGVDSPVRAFKAVGGQPLFIESGSGSKVYDLDGREYVDYVGSYGPAILGHAHEEVTAALRQSAGCGTSFGAPNEAETVLAEMIVERVSSVEKVRFVNSGTEAVMTACRLARGVTGRDI
ncbi:MAG TPA: aminotransferase class III-fold pyridoxal phosphate-dependent enzyme, partial [Phycisphaerae bacterium]|nr:aminotransferase class III-fold pyridoxal phosphate-dependent enzyme [Phycisphaerae bacterium]